MIIIFVIIFNFIIINIVLFFFAFICVLFFSVSSMIHRGDGSTDPSAHLTTPPDRGEDVAVLGAQSCRRVLAAQPTAGTTATPCEDTVCVFTTIVVCVCVRERERVRVVWAIGSDPSFMAVPIVISSA
jgi:hypothetical protein